MLAVGATVSLDAVAGTSPGCNLAPGPGKMCMSARRFIIACLTLRSSGVGVLSSRSGSWFGSKPQAHITVPAPKTIAPQDEIKSQAVRGDARSFDMAVV